MISTSKVSAAFTLVGRVLESFRAPSVIETQRKVTEMHAQIERIDERTANTFRIVEQLINRQSK